MKFIKCEGDSCMFGGEPVTEGALTKSAHEIGIASDYGWMGIILMIVHEPGHAFNLILGRMPEHYTDTYLIRIHPELLRNTKENRSKNDRGFYSNYFPYTVAWPDSYGLMSEEFADNFLSWVMDN